MIKIAATALIVAAIGAGVVSNVLLGGKPREPAAKAKPKEHRYRDGPVHGLMLLPLADPDGRVPTANLSR